MRKIILTYGLISGAIITTFTLISMYISYRSAELSGSMVLGFSAMIIAFSLIFPAVKKFRDQHLKGQITFGKAFLVAVSIAFIASTMYVIGWIIEFHTLMPDFLDRYIAFSILELQKSKLSIEQLSLEIANLETYRGSYDTLSGMVAMTYVEIFPVGLLMSLIAGLVLKRAEKKL